MMDHTETPPQDVGEMTVTLTVNGESRPLSLKPNVVLLDALRDRLGLTGTKKGCDHGQCGACTVQIDGKAINACLRLAALCEGQRITTVEGLARDGQLHPVQQAFLDRDAYQCGFCTPGQMMSAAALLEDARIGDSDAEVREAMSGNICRCGAYKNILGAIQDARAHSRPADAGGEQS